MTYEELMLAVEQASRQRAVVYIYTDGDYQINAKGLTNAVKFSGHDIALEIDCTNVTEEAFSPDGDMFEGNIDEILNQYDLDSILKD